MEVACCIVKKSKLVTVVGMESVPFERVLGSAVGSIMQQFHERQGIKFIMNAVAKEFQKGTDNYVHTVVLKDDTKLVADIIIIGAGVVPVTSFVKDSPSIKREKDRSVIVDKYLYTGADGLYAAGDIARFPLSLLDNEYVRIEHYGIAQSQGAVAALNMIAPTHNHPFTNVPFFWTSQHGKSFRYVGHALKYDKVILDTLGEAIDPSNPKFVAYYCHNDIVVAVCTVQRDPIAAQVAEIMNAKITLRAEDIQGAISSTNTANSVVSGKLKT